MRAIILYVLLSFSLFLLSCSGGYTTDTLTNPSRGESSRPGGGGSEGGTGDGSDGAESGSGGSGGSGSGASAIPLSQLTTGYSISSKRVHLYSGGSTTVTVNLDTPASQSAVIPYSLYGKHYSDFLNILSEPLNEIYVAEGASSFSFDLSHPLNPSFTKSSNILLVLDDKDTKSSNLLISVHTDDQTKMDSLDLGYNHGCGINDGELFCWGKDSNDQLGNGPTTTEVPFPQKITTSTSWSQISAGNSHSCGIMPENFFVGVQGIWKRSEMVLVHRMSKLPYKSEVALHGLGCLLEKIIHVVLIIMNSTAGAAILMARWGMGLPPIAV